MGNLPPASGIVGVTTATLPGAVEVEARALEVLVGADEVVEVHGFLTGPAEATASAETNSRRLRDIFFSRLLDESV